jgi:hypothetical protein
MDVGGQFHAPTVLTAGKNPGTHRIRGWVVPRAGLDGFIPLNIQRIEQRSKQD